MCNLMETYATTTVDPMDEITVRPANQLDAEAIAEIHNQYIGVGAHTMERDSWTRLTVKAQLDHFNDRETMVVCEDLYGEVVGWGIVKQYSPRGGYRIACEMSTYVSRQAQGHGVGSKILEELILASRRLGYHHAVAKIIARNEKSIQFHQKHGFELVGIQREIGLVEGQLADVAILQRIDSDKP